MGPNNRYAPPPFPSFSSSPYPSINYSFYSDPDDFTAYNTNVSGPVRVIQAFLPLVKKSDKKVILNISSIMGSNASQGFINDFLTAISPTADFTNYRISKAALNAGMSPFLSSLSPSTCAYFFLFFFSLNSCCCPCNGTQE
jgi:hypothetical protein